MKQGHRVTCASFTSRLLENEYCDIPRDAELLDGVSQRERLFREYVPNSDIVWVSRPHNMAAFLKGRAEKGVSSRARIIYDAEAIFAERDWRQAEILGSEVSSTLKTAWLGRELALAKAADAVVVVSRHNRETMVSGGVRRVSIIGHQVCANPTAAAFDERRTFLFVGAMHGTDSPNADSMRYFCQLNLAGCSPSDGRQVDHRRVRYRLTCPQCGHEFWAVPSLVKTSVFDGGLKGFRCPKKNCDAIVSWERTQ